MYTHTHTQQNKPLFSEITKKEECMKRGILKIFTGIILNAISNPTQ
jgi:hypothetical protein